MKDSSVGVSEAIVLAGGRGTRLQSVIPGQQKVVAQVAGFPFIERVIEQIEVAGIRRIILAVGYASDQVKQAVSNFEFPGVDIVFSEETEPLGTGGAVRNCLPLVSEDNVLILNGDSLVKFPLIEFLNFHHVKTADLSMLLCNVADISRFGEVILGDDEQILGLREKQGLSVRGWINAGIYAVKKSLIASMPVGSYSFETDVLSDLTNILAFGLRVDAPFLDIGTPVDFSKAADFVVKD